MWLWKGEKMTGRAIYQKIKNSSGFLCYSYTEITPPQTTALADVPWDIQVNQNPIINIILPGNSGSRMPSAASSHLRALPQRHNPVSATHTHIITRQPSKYKQAFLRDEKFQLRSLISDFSSPRLWLLIGSQFQECRLGRQQTLCIQLTCNISKYQCYCSF